MVNNKKIQTKINSREERLDKAQFTQREIRQTQIRTYLEKQEMN